MPLSNPSFPAARAAVLRCSIVIPVYRGGRHFEGCVRSVAAAMRAEDELLVVANGEGDGTWRAAESVGARILHRAQNGGPAQARNLGAQHANGDILVFIDADVSVPADCITRIAAAFAADEKLAAVIGSYDDSPGEPNFLSQFKNLFHHFVHQRGAEDASTFWGACGAIRRRTFLELGGFDESYERSSIEDIELGYRLRSRLHRIRLMHELQVKHWKRWDVITLLRSDFVDRAAPWTELLLRRRLRNEPTIPNDLNLGFAFKASLVTSAALLATFVGSIFSPWLLLFVVPLAVLFGALNLPLLRFFKEKRGWRFCCGAVCWRFLYDLCSGMGLCLGALRFATRKPARCGQVSRRGLAVAEVGAPSQALR